MLLELNKTKEGIGLKSLTRKFLIDEVPFDLSFAPKRNIEIGYISTKPLIVITDNEGICHMITAYNDEEKETIQNLSLLNYDFLTKNALIPDTNLIKKTNYSFHLNGNLQSIISFYKDNLEGFNTIEVRFLDEEQSLDFEMPFWFKEELPEDINDLALSYFTKGDVRTLLLK